MGQNFLSTICLMTLITLLSRPWTVCDVNQGSYQRAGGRCPNSGHKVGAAIEFLSWLAFIRVGDAIGNFVLQCVSLKIKIIDEFLQ